MFDAHCHILPGLDHGAVSFDESIKMAKHLINNGMRFVVATPHVIEGNYYISPETILTYTTKLQQILNIEGLPLRVLPGAENYLLPNIPELVKEGKLLTFAKDAKYIMIELPSINLPYYLEEVLFKLQVMGITPIIAHPERNLIISKSRNILEEWVNRGIVLQLDLGSVIGRYGRTVRLSALDSLRKGLYGLIGSDAHNSSDLRNLPEALSTIKKLVGVTNYCKLTEGFLNKIKS